MNKENSDLMQMSRDSLEGKWGLAIGTFVVYIILIGAANTFFPLSLIVSGPLALGITVFSLAIARNEEAHSEQIFSGFTNFVTALSAYLLIVVFVCLWALLLIVPGIIMAFSYSLTFYIISDNPSIKAMDALKKSKQMMEGHKMRLFYLCLNFFLLSLVCLLTLGIGFLWLIPFMHVTMAKFYDDIKGNQISLSFP